MCCILYVMWSDFADFLPDLGSVFDFFKEFPRSGSIYDLIESMLLLNQIVPHKLYFGLHQTAFSKGSIDQLLQLLTDESEDFFQGLFIGAKVYA